MPQLQDEHAESSRPAAPAADTRGAPRNGDDAPDPLARLKKMSTTAGVGSQDYVAVNPMAVAALVLGLASALVFLHDVLLLIPLAGIVCAVIAWRQIRYSNGTQTGRLMAAAGLLLCVLIGGGRLAHRTLGEWTNRGDKAQIQRLVSQLGDNLRHQEYLAAYNSFTERFRQRVSADRFTEVFRQANAHPDGGGIAGLEWNGRVEFEEEPQSNARNAYTMALFRFKKAAEPGRLTVVLRKEGDRWQLDDMPNMFPREKKTPGGAAAPGGPDGM